MSAAIGGFSDPCFVSEIEREEEREAARLAARRGFELNDTQPAPAVDTSAIDAEARCGIPVAPSSLLVQLGSALAGVQLVLEQAEEREADELEHDTEVSFRTREQLHAARQAMRSVLALGMLVRQLPIEEQLRERPLSVCP